MTTNRSHYAKRKLSAKFDDCQAAPYLARSMISGRLVIYKTNV